MDGVREAAPGIVAALRSGPSAPIQAPAPSIAPGSVAAVDLPAARRKKRRRLAAPAPAPAQTAAPTEAAPAPAAPVEASVPAVETPAASAADFKPDFPTADMNQEDVIKLLVVDIEQALKADWGEDRVFTEIVQKFPESILAILRLVPADQAAEQINKVVPADWTVGTPRGQRMVRKLLERLKG
jgi:hypothetical protein